MYLYIKNTKPLNPVLLQYVEELRNKYLEIVKIK